MTRKQRRVIEYDAIDIKAQACIGCGCKQKIVVKAGDNCITPTISSMSVRVDCSAVNGNGGYIKACGESSFEKCLHYIRFLSVDSRKAKYCATSDK